MIYSIKLSDGQLSILILTPISNTIIAVHIRVITNTIYVHIELGITEITIERSDHR